MYAKSTCIKTTTVILAAIAALAVSGCVERQLTINTDPQGALVTLNDEQIGNTPVTVEFNWYGDYRVNIEKQGYETLNTHKELERPLHDKFPFDFFAEVLYPGKISDNYQWDFTLTEYKAPDRQELIDMALKMQTEAETELNTDAETAD